MKSITLFLTALLVAASSWLTPAAQAQTCAAPANISVTSPTNTTAVVNFTPVANAVSYTVRYFWTGDSTAAGITTLTTVTSPATLTGLQASAYYIVTVRSNCAGGGTSGAVTSSFQAGGTGTFSCAAPTNVTATATGATTASVSFTPAAGALTHTVHYYPLGTNQTTTISANTSPVALSGLQPNTSYGIRVTTTCGNGYQSSPATTTVRTNPAATSCGTVTNLNVAVTGANTATVTFTPVAGAISYTLVYFAPGDSTQRPLTVSGSPVYLSGLLPSKGYTVRVVTNCAGGATSAAVIRTFTTNPAPAPCGAVTNVVVTATSNSTATVSFTPGQNNTTFRITYYVPGDSSRWVNSNASPVTRTGLVPGQTYHIQVTSICGTAGSTTSASGGNMTFAFRGTSALGTHAALGAGFFEAYPNPAHHAVSLMLPAVANATKAQVVLLNAVGQQVRVSSMTLGATGTRTQFDLTGVAAGLYTLRVTAGGQAASQRLVVE